MLSSGQTSNVFLITLGIVGVFGIITFALAAATLGTLNKRYSNLDQDADMVMELVNQINARLFTNNETSEPSTAQSNTGTAELMTAQSNTGTAELTTAQSNTGTAELTTAPPTTTTTGPTTTTTTGPTTTTTTGPTTTTTTGPT
ncbi:unnamed protein product, partial [Rotaria magnacalcarata]